MELNELQAIFDSVTGKVLEQTQEIPEQIIDMGPLNSENDNIKSLLLSIQEEFNELQGILDKKANEYTNYSLEVLQEAVRPINILHHPLITDDAFRSYLRFRLDEMIKERTKDDGYFK